MKPYPIISFDYSITKIENTPKNKRSYHVLIQPPKYFILVINYFLNGSLHLEASAMFSSVKVLRNANKLALSS